MSKFHASVRDFLEDVHCFLASTLAQEVLSSSALTHKENLVTHLTNLNEEYPQLQLSLKMGLQSDGKKPSSRPDSIGYPPSSPLPYVDMNGGSPYKMPSFGSFAEDGNYDVCSIKERPSSENRSLTESEDNPYEEGEKSYPDVAANELYSSEKFGYLEKKKRESLKGWLNPFQKRWCAIKDGAMYYFEKSTDRKQKGAILLAGYEARPLPEVNNKDGKKFNFCFELVCPGRRTYQFAALTANDLKQWIVAIEHNNKIVNSGTAVIQNIEKNKKSESLPHIAEDIYESVDDEEDVVSEKLTLKIEHVESSVNDSLTDKNYTDAKNAIPSSQIFSYKEWYVSLWDCWGNDETELTFLRGDLIHVISKEYDSFAWWIGELQGKIGFVPKSYLMEAYEPC